MKHLVLGGARSGKSRFAEQELGLISEISGLQKIYIASSQASDSEMRERIIHHQALRDSSWITVEEPIHLGEAIRENDSPNNCILIDCLTLWLNNCLLNKVWQEERWDFIDALENAPSPVILVGNEVGNGITPANPLSRKFVDEAGRLHQELATLCDRVSLVCAGIPLALKPQ
ncbi:MAG: adenosylcobinamide kinase/adenosylcobinamide-phosphate guanylyltransferase [Flavobacteriales bacterium]|jgi:adenosylcobinamide kinase/adenosylcobinamide-phosphate guanylyltransferase